MNDNLKNNQIDENEVENVTGGAGIQIMNIACPDCGTINMVNIMLDCFTCKKCGKKHIIAG